MDKIATENLFLLEFLVDKVNLDPSAARDVGDMMGETCVSVQFLDNLPLDICEDDFTPKRDYKKDSDALKSGKSCLFSLTAIQAQEAVRKFDVLVQIYKKMQPGVLPEKVQIGNSLISIVNLFNELIRSISASNNNQTPTAKTLKDTFKITNLAGQTIGEISMYIRMSCFGKLIVTQFQMNLEDKSVLFKDKEGHSLYRYKKVGSRRGGSTGGYDGPSSGGGYGAGGGYGGTGGYGGRSSGGMNSECPMPPCARPVPTTQISTPCNECTLPNDPPGCYQEIGASMGGNALTIRVHKDKNKLEQLNDNGSNMGSCSCNQWNSGGTTKRGSKTTSQSCPAETNVVMRPGCTDSSVANQPISFKMGGCGVAANNNVTVVPPVCTAPDGTQYTEVSDPERDVFVLRIGKKSEGADKKNNLELELCTPKGPDLKPSPKKETRDAQWNDDDAKEAGWKGENGGKKGKGKKRRSSKLKTKKEENQKPGYCHPPHFIGEPRPDKCATSSSDSRCVKIQTCYPQYSPCPPVYSAPIPCIRPMSTCTFASSESYGGYGSYACPSTPSCRMWS